MAILNNVWRFQCDTNGEDDPTVQAFLKKTLVDPDTGETFDKQDVTPVNMKFSELAGGLRDLIDASKVSAVAETQKAEVGRLRIDTEAQPVPLTRSRTKRKVSRKLKRRA
jgi:hypothetical protein